MKLAPGASSSGSLDGSTEMSLVSLGPLSTSPQLVAPWEVWPWGTGFEVSIRSFSVSSLCALSWVRDVSPQLLLALPESATSAPPSSVLEPPTPS